MTARHEIETERMLIRSYHHADLDEHVAILSNWEVTRWLSDNIPFPYSREEGEKFIENAKDNFEGAGTIYFSINEKNTMRHMGGIKLFAPKSVDCEVGYWLGPDFWGAGYGTELLLAIVLWVQNNTSVKNLIAQIAEENFGSRKLLEKTGFSHRGKPPPEFARCGHGAGCSEYYVLSVNKGLKND